jgi:hypothetical protein
MTYTAFLIYSNLSSVLFTKRKDHPFRADKFPEKHKLSTLVTSINNIYVRVHSVVATDYRKCGWKLIWEFEKIYVKTSDQHLSASVCFWYIKLIKILLNSIFITADIRKLWMCNWKERKIQFTIATKERHPSSVCLYVY